MKKAKFKVFLELWIHSFLWLGPIIWITGNAFFAPEVPLFPSSLDTPPMVYYICLYTGVGIILSGVIPTILTIFIKTDEVEMLDIWKPNLKLGFGIFIGIVIIILLGAIINLDNGFLFRILPLFPLILYFRSCDNMLAFIRMCQFKISGDCPKIYDENGNSRFFEARREYIERVLEKYPEAEKYMDEKNLENYYAYKEHA